MRSMGFGKKLRSLFSVDDTYEYVDEPNHEENQADEHPVPRENVVKFTSMKQSTSKVVLSEPKAYSEAQEIADQIVNRRSVVINLEQVHHDQAKRIVDFLSGTVYAVNGDIQKLGSQTFLCTPDNVEVTGSIRDTLEDVDDFNKGW